MDDEGAQLYNQNLWLQLILYSKQGFSYGAAVGI